MSDGVNLVAYDDLSGLGQIGRLVAEALRRGGIPHSIVPLGRRSFRNWPRQRTAPFETNLVCVNAQMLPGLVEMLGQSFFRDRRTIGFWWWEVDRFPSVMSWAAHLVDEIWVGSDHVRAAISSSVSTPVYTFPVPITKPPVAPIDRGRFAIPRDRFAFLLSFSFWSVFARKNPLGLIDAFSRAFSAGEGPILILKTVSGRDFPHERRALQESASRRADVLVLDRRLAPAEYGGLVAAVDAYASLHRAEGFGLTIAEAMALGKPAIATGYSGNLEFMTDENSYLVPSDLVPIPPQTGPYPPGGHWGEPDLAVASALLRRVVEQPEEVSVKTSTALEDIARDHGFSKAAAFVRRRLDETPAPRTIPTDPIERAAAELMWGPDLESARPLARKLRQLARPVLRPYVDHHRRVGALVLEALACRDDSTPRAKPVTTPEDGRSTS